MSQVFVAGSLHWDVVVDAPRLPELDETLMGTRVTYRFGGKGGNQAVAAARMGARVAMAGRIGRDEAGARLRDALGRAGVDHTQVQDCDHPSGMSVAIVDAQGDYGAVVVSGANRALDEAQIMVPDGLKVLLLQNEVPEAVNSALAQRAGEEATVILNAAPARTLSADLLAAVDVLIVNRVEAAQLLGGSPDTLDPEPAARALTALGPATAIVTLGAEGLVLAEGGSCQSLPACPVEARSTHGAGDMFCGALAAALARGGDFRGGCRFAAAAAALAVSTPAEQRDQITPEAARRLAEA